VTVSVPAADAIMTPAEFDGWFAGLFEREAFRLELLDCYDSPAARERVQRFMAGEREGQPARAFWDGLLAEARRAGKSMSRVHVVSEPLTNYLRWELDYYRGSVAAGEDIRIIPRARAAGLDLPGFDFWLFDGRAAAVMVYDERGAWLHSEIVTDLGFVAACCHWRDVAMHHATELGTYMAGSEAV